MTAGSPGISRRAVIGGLVLGGPLALVSCAGADPTSGARPDADTATPPTPPPRLSADTRRIAYGPGPRRFGHLDLPAGDPPPDGWPVAVLIHGGFWRTGYSVDLMFGIARSLHEDGWATWNIQYSAVGDRSGGRWPGPFQDVARAIDHLDTIDDGPIDRTRVIAIGHSAGGHLALWAAGRAGLPPDAPGAGPRVPLTAVVSQAGITDLLSCVDADLGDGACLDMMDALPREDLTRYLLASPIERLPSGVPTLLVHGDRDRVVPVSQSRRFVTRAREADEDPVLLVIEGADHFAPIDATHEAWNRVRDRLPDLTT